MKSAKPYKLQTIDLDVPHTAALPPGVHSTESRWSHDPRALQYGASSTRPGEKEFTLTAFTRLIPLTSDDGIRSQSSVDSSPNAVLTNWIALRGGENEPTNPPSGSSSSSAQFDRLCNDTANAAAALRTTMDDNAYATLSTPNADSDTKSSRDTGSGDGADPVVPNAVTVARHIMHVNVNWMSSTRSVVARQKPSPANDNSVK